MQIVYDDEVYALVKKEARRAQITKRDVKYILLTEAEALELYADLAVKPQHQSGLPATSAEFLTLLRDENELYELFKERIVCEPAAS